MSNDNAGLIAVLETMADEGSLIHCLDWAVIQSTLRNAATALRSIEAVGRIHEGWKLVPVEPTNAMFEALYSGPEKPVGEKWDAMLVVAPSPDDIVGSK